MIVIALDGVLRTKNKVSVPIVMQWLKATTDVASTAIVADGKKDEAEAWLRINGFTSYSLLLGDEVPRRSDSLREDQIAVLRTSGVIRMLIDPDPENIKWALEQGIQSMLFLQPKYSRPEFRPDAPRKVRPWDEMVAEISRQQEYYDADQRIGGEVFDDKFGD